MKKTISFMSSFLLIALLVTGAMASPSKTQSAPAKKAKAVKSDADIQSCITQKLAAAPKLKDQGLSATVSGGAATFTGTAQNAGSKGSVTGIAKSCGAKQIVNNITVKPPEKGKAKGK